MAHPLEEVIRGADRFVLIGDSSRKRFPAMSYHNYTKVGKPFYCLDLGGLTESRGPTKGGKVYTSVADLPDDRGDLAIIWATKSQLKAAVDAAVEAGCKRVWFSFKSCDEEAVEHARDQGLEVVEIGRCPVYYMDKHVPACKAHTLMVKLSGAYKKPPQTDPTAKRREMI
jgi:hypothetical protein